MHDYATIRALLREAGRGTVGVLHSFSSGRALLEEALTEVDASDHDLRIDLLAGLARALGFLSEPERAEVVRESAIALARERGGERGLATILVRSYWSRGSHATARRESTNARSRASSRSNAGRGGAIGSPCEGSTRSGSRARSS